MNRHKEPEHHITPVGLLTGKVVFITGASRGIGAAAARLFAAEGAAAVLASRNTDALVQIVAEIRAGGGVDEQFAVNFRAHWTAVNAEAALMRRNGGGAIAADRRRPGMAGAGRSAHMTKERTSMKTAGNTILITGGTSGIGLGLALRFQQAGNKVIVAGRRKDLLDRIATEHPGLATLVLDVTDPTSIVQAHRTVTRTHPEVNVLINNAGIQLPERLLGTDSLRIAEDTVATNLLGPIRMISAFLPDLTAQDDAVIINVSSGLAFVPLPSTPTYNASKAAVHSFTESLRIQLADTPVQVIELVPPAVRTTLMGQQDNEHAMPLEDFLTEAVNLLHAHPDAEEILVENVKFLRHATANGTYDDVLAMLSAY
jgi:short-subunit dehydrogenase involved in D-alanine esterification of teichoic acids